ncbi:ThuA domain-containing protein [Actinoplanes bogorensis]|uniref:ThuA domain-containing protein n=1 Tax=Paractinoplanes bogorensis TaxID=1610840 RepID=A0ABS5YV88_9ACTN|nr:ThuA domain-containing protein [Actinoplanes bogorensis]MBU2667283.1 ThuA domain-containing protein [Actinoplanes bogorensis]
MRRAARLITAAAVAAPFLFASPAAAHSTDVLVFATSSNAPTVREIKGLGFDVTVTTKASDFTTKKLSPYEAVVFLRDGEVLDATQRAAFEAYVGSGKGFAGVRSAAETAGTWTFYDELLGARVTGTAAASAGTVTLTDPAPKTFPLTEQWYTFDTDVRGKQHVLATAAEKPVSWCQDFRGGRSWYSGLSVANRADSRQHLLTGIRWAATGKGLDCGATVESNYEKVTLNDEPGEPMTLAVLPDGRVLHNTRGGQVRMYDPATGLSPVIATVPVYVHDEDGLQSVAIDPDFVRNKWVYIYYAPRLNTPVDDPATPSVNEGDAPATSDDPTTWDKFKGYNQVSRVKLVETPTPHLDLSTEQKILRVDTDRGICCHVGGEIKFDGKGNLYLVTGDDTNASGSDGFTPINESPTQGPGYDAQRSAANTNDLRGKVLRIKVKADGSYTIPDGNLFRKTSQTRPEIFLMGLRNPFRFDVSKTGYVYVGDYSPDSRVPSATRGPEGTGRWIGTDKAGNYGWPYCYSPDLPYIDFDFVSRTSGAAFNCKAPVNESPRNTGLRNLPPVRTPQLNYTFNALTPCPGAYLATPPTTCGFQWPALGTGGVGPMGGPIYRSSQVKGDHEFPAYYDNTVVFGEFTRDKLFALRTDGKDKLLAVEPMLSSFVFDNPMDMEFGPNGELYVLEYGDGFFRANPDAQLAVVRYVKGGRAPTAAASATPTSGQAPLTVAFSSAGTTDGVTLAWDFDGNGTVDSTATDPSFTYTTNGVYNARLTVTDSSGRTGVATRTITVGNTAPVVEVVTPANGSFFAWGDTIPFEVRVTDPEDGPVDCSRVEVTLVLGHDEHGHGINSTTGCTGSLPSPADGADHAGGYLFLGVSASYTDRGTPALSTTGQAIVQTWRQQAETAQVRTGTASAATNDVDGDQHLTAIDDGDAIAFRPIDLNGVDGLTLRVAGGSATTVGAPRAQVEVRLGSPTGELVTTATVTATAGTGAWASQRFPISHAGGEQTLYLVFKPVAGGPATNLFNLNWVEFD